MKRIELEFRTRDLVDASILPAALFDHNRVLTIPHFVLLPRRTALILARLERLPGHFNPDRFPSRLAAIRREYALQSLALLGAEPERRQYVLLMRARVPSLLSKWLEETRVDALPSSALHADSERTRLSLFVPTASCEPFAEFLKGLGIPFSLRTRSVRGLQDDLTPRQRELLLRALELGYYDLPARTTLDRLAAIAGISKATLSRHLRKAEKRVLVRYFARPLGLD